MLKKILSYIILYGLIFTVFGCSKTKQWYKGNLHAHSYWSDGQEFPEMIMDWYKTNGYNFTVLSDHNILAEGDKWITVSEKEYLQKGFQNYLKKYGDNWVNHNIDSSGKTIVKLKTYQEYKSLFEENANFLIIQSEEISAKFDKKPIHINATNIQDYIEPLKGKSVVDVIQNNIDAILKQRKNSKTPILPHINHPNYLHAISVNDFMQLKNVHFFEVFNGHPSTNNEGDSTHISTEKMWDLINVSYLEKQQPLLYGVAVDDSHQYNKFTKHTSNPGRGWIMVQADSLNAKSIINAMEKGNFYATTGVILDKVSFLNNTLKIKVEQKPEVDYQIQFIGIKSGETKTKILNTINGFKAEFELTEDYLFVRSKIVSNKVNKNFFGKEFEKAWTQPVIYKKE